MIQTTKIAGVVIDRGLFQECTGGAGCPGVFSDVGQVTANPGAWVIPEPSTASLLALGLVGLAARRAGRRR